MRDETLKPYHTDQHGNWLTVCIGNVPCRLRKHHTFSTGIATFFCTIIAICYCVEFTRWWLSWLFSDLTTRILLTICIPFWVMYLVKYVPLIYLMEPVDEKP